MEEGSELKMEARLWDRVVENKSAWKINRAKASAPSDTYEEGEEDCHSKNRPKREKSTLMLKKASMPLGKQNSY